MAVCLPVSLVRLHHKFQDFLLYCDARCQRAHWPQHELVCPHSKAATTAATTITVEAAEAEAAEEEEISSPPDLSVTRRFDFAEPDLSAAECHAPAFPAATGHDRATRELSSTQQHNNISSGPKQI